MRAFMKRIPLTIAVLLLVAAGAQAQWTQVSPGVEYRRFNDKGRDIHVTRIDLTSDAVRVVVTREAERGMKVSQYAKKNKAIVAINADYFDKLFVPVGLTIGRCGQWEGTKDTSREGVIAIGDRRGRIDPQKEVMDPPEKWVESAVSGWPLLVNGCKVIDPLPGSDGFTRSPHPRSAVALSNDSKKFYLIVSDGRREDVPGLTLPQLAEFIADELGACTAMNLDGGGSSAMWLDGKIVNHPSDGVERRVGNHIAIIKRTDDAGCAVGDNMFPAPPPAPAPAPAATTTAP